MQQSLQLLRIEALKNVGQEIEVLAKALIVHGPCELAVPLIRLVILELDILSELFELDIELVE